MAGNKDQEADGVKEECISEDEKKGLAENRNWSEAGRKDQNPHKPTLILPKR